MRFALLFLASATLAAQSPEKLFQERKLGEARSAAQSQLAANANDANAMFWLGRVAAAENRNDEALKWFEKAVKLEARNALYHFWVGNIIGEEAQNASKVKQPFMARRIKAEFEKAVALDPTLIEAREGLMGFYQQAPGFMGGSNEKARVQVAEIRKLNPYRGHFAGARYAERDKDAAGAAKEWENAIAAFPDSAVPYYNLAGYLRRQGNWEEAFAVYERVMTAKPDELIAHLGWGAVSAQSGLKYERGERELRHFLANASVEKHGSNNVAGAHFRLGQILEKTNRRDQARPAYEETLKINPQHADAKKALAALK